MLVFAYPVMTTADLKLAFCVIYFTGVLSSCATIENYLDPHGPKYAESFAKKSTISNSIKVVSFNIKFAEKTGQAIEELKKYEELQNADIVLLQEMNQDSTHKIAETLGYNYIYYPASKHTHHRKDFGNAILARWPIKDEQKIILPHAQPLNKQKRIAVAATVTIDGNEIRVYSAHTETIWLCLNRRIDQAKKITASLPDNGFIIVGGDFNTYSHEAIDDTEKVFKQAGLRWVTEQVGSTSKVLGGVYDYIFVRNLNRVDAGKIQTEASDHLPIWVTLEIDNDGPSTDRKSN